MTFRPTSLLCLAALCVPLGCARDNESDNSPVSRGDGEVRLGLAIASGIDIDEVTYTVELTGYTPLTGTLAVTDGDDSIGTVSGIPAAAEVKVTLDAESARGQEATCHGEGTVAVEAGKTTSIFIVLQCRLPDGTPVTTGAIDISGSINVCPQVTSAIATADDAGGFALAAEASDLDTEELTYAWTAASGSFEDAAAAGTVYSCSEAGSVTLTITADDGKGCTHAKDVEVNCEPAADAGTTPPADAGGGIDAGTPPDEDAGSSPEPELDSGAPEEDAGPTPEPEVDAGAPTPEPGLCEAPSANDCEECGCTTCAMQMTACSTMEGTAAEGPAAGFPKSALCMAVVQCGRRTGCRGSECFCGAGTDLVACLTGSPTGPCQEEIKAAAETVDPAMVSARQSEPGFAIAGANAVSSCTVNSCTAACTTTPI